jgi:hypothetical protein
LTALLPLYGYIDLIVKVNNLTLAGQSGEELMPQSLDQERRLSELLAIVKDANGMLPVAYEIPVELANKAIVHISTDTLRVPAT